MVLLRSTRPPAPPSRQLFLLIGVAGWILLGGGSARAHAPLSEQIEEVSRRIAASPASARLYLDRGEKLRMLGDFTRARADYERAAALDPGLAEIDLCRAALSVDAGEPEEAIAPLGRYLDRLDQAGTAVTGAARAHLERGDAAAALRALMISSRSAPSAAPAAAGPDGVRAVLTRGPYLQCGTPTSMVVRWRTDAATDSRVWYGPAPDSLLQEAMNSNLVTEHEIKVTGLSADTRYAYAVGDAEGILAGADPDHTFTTSPGGGAPKPTRIWVIGDSGAANDGARSVRDAFLEYTGARGADLWLMLGDNAYFEGTDAQYQAAVFDMYPMLLRNTVLWPTRGNHDFLYDGPGNDYYDMFTLPRYGEAGGFQSVSEAYYSFDYGNIHFICLDSEGSLLGPNDPMLNWLRHDLETTTETWTIAYWHHAPYSWGSHNSDDILDSEGRMVHMRENALPILEEGGVDLVLCGHSHDYERSFLLDGHYGYSWTLNGDMIVDGGDGRITGDGAYHKPSPVPAPHEGAVYAVMGSSSLTGGGGLGHPVMIVDFRLLGSMVLDIDGLQLDALFLNSYGQWLDRFTIVKGTPEDAPDHENLVQEVHGRSSPNPFHREVSLRFSLPREARVLLSIVDAQGRRVATLLEGASFGAGEHTVTWDGRDDRGHELPSGVYQQVLNVEGVQTTGRLVLVR